MNQIGHKIGAFFTFFVSFIVYFITLSPTVSLWDCGEFITCAVTMGVPHPPGAPLYLMVGKIFSMFPFGADDAFRVNTISALSTAFSVMILYLIIVSLLQEFKGIPHSWCDKISIYGGGILGALTFAFTDTLWFNAVEAEVYAPSILFTVLTLWLALKWMEHKEDASSLKYFLASIYLIGLSVGVHLLNVLAFPTILMLVFYYKRNLAFNIVLLGMTLIFAVYFIWPLLLRVFGFSAEFPNSLMWLYAIIFIITYVFLKNIIQLDFKLWSIVIVLLCIGWTTYIMIYLRAGLGPVINENDPSNLERFLSYLNREQYGTESLFTTIFQRKAPLWLYQIKKMYLRYFAWNFIGQGTTLGPDRYILETFSPRGLYYLPFVLGITGMWYHFKNDPKRALAILALFIFTGVAIVLYLNQPDPQPRERDYVYIGSFCAFAIWIGIGFSGIIAKVGDYCKNNKPLQKPAVIGVIAVCFAVGPALEFNHNLSSHDRRGNFMAWDYAYNILQSCDQDGIIFTNGDNDTFPLWYLQEVESVRKDVNVVNLSLLNTNWYIKQLKYGDPAVPVSLSDNDIEKIAPFAWNETEKSMPVSAAVYNEYIRDVHEKFQLREVTSDFEINFTMAPTLSAGGSDGIRVQDFMVEHIIRANGWKRPVYIAMTVSESNKIGLQNYLRTDGLSFKLVPFSNRNLAVHTLESRLIDTFKYRGINDSDIYYDRTQSDMMQNLRVAFLNVANFYSTNSMTSDAARVIDAMEERIPADVIPFPDHNTRLQIAQLYFSNKEFEKVSGILEHILEEDPGSFPKKKDVARFYAQFLKDYKKSAALLIDYLQATPFESEAYSLLISIFRQENNYSDAALYLNKWLEQYPNDSNAQSLLLNLEQLRSEIDSTQ